MLIQDFVKSKSLPAFLTNNKRLVACKDVKKIFPRIGLPNGSTPCVVDNKYAIEREAIDLLQSMFTTSAFYAETHNNYVQASRPVYTAITSQFRLHALSEFINWRDGH